MMLSFTKELICRNAITRVPTYEFTTTNYTSLK